VSTRSCGIRCRHSDDAQAPQLNILTALHPAGGTNSPKSPLYIERDSRRHRHMPLRRPSGNGCIIHAEHERCGGMLDGTYFAE
jgi:hypothetical protein